MKKIILSVIALGALLSSCAKYDEAIVDLQQRVEALEQLTGEVQTLKDLVAGQLFVSSCVEKDGEYTILLSDGTVVNTHAGMTDKPVITVITENSRTYWAYYQDGQVQPLLFNGKKVEVTAVTPSLKFNDEGRLEISVDGGRTWVISDGKISGGLFSDVRVEDSDLVLVMADGFTEFRIPMEVEAQTVFMSFSGKQFFTNKQTKTIAVEMVGIKSYTVTEKPEGWKVSLTNGQLTVTAPASGEGDTSGYIKMIGVGEQTAIAQLYVTIGKAPCLLAVEQTGKVTITPNPQSFFYGACLLEDFDAKTIASELSGVFNPMLTRHPFSSSKLSLQLADMVSEVVEGETYVVWTLPATGEACTELDVMYEAITSIGVNCELSNITFEDARISVSVKGTDTYYLIPLENELTLDNVIEDLSGAYAATYDRYKHVASYRGLLSDMIEAPMAGQTYKLLVLPVKLGQLRKDDARTIEVKLGDYVRGGSSTVALTAGGSEYKSVSVNVDAVDAYKVVTSVVSASDYTIKGYDSDDALLSYLLGCTANKYTDKYVYTANNLESGSTYWVVAVAIDRNGFVGAPSRLEVSTKGVVYSTTATLSVAKLDASLNSASITLGATGNVTKVRYMCLSEAAGGFWYSKFVDDDAAAYEALIYGSIEFTEITAIDAPVVFKDLDFGTNYLFCAIGYDNEGKITNMARQTFAPTVGQVVAFSEAEWSELAPQVSARIQSNEMFLTINFPMGLNYVLTKMSSEEFDTHVSTLRARLRVDYVLSHNAALTFSENLSNYNPDWYISDDKPYLLITWQAPDGMWFEPLIYDTATGTILNK